MRSFGQLQGRISNASGIGAVRTVAVLTAFGSLLMLGGCISEKVTLDLGIPVAYRESPKPQSYKPPPLDWWRSFRTKELIWLMEEAQTANFDVAAAVARIVQADAQAKIASAALYPEIGLQANAVRTRASRANGGSGRAERVTYTAGFGGPNGGAASYQLDFFGRNHALSRAAEHTAVASRFDRDVVNLTALVAVATAYFLVAEGQERLRLARRNVAASERILNLIRQRAQAGTASDLNVAQQETLVNQLRASIPPFDELVRQNKATLALLIGRAPALTNIRGTALYGIAIPQVTAGMPSELMIQRPDIREAEEALASAGASVEAARAAFYPTITLTGTYGVVSTALKNLFTPQAIFYTIAAGLTQPIFDGFNLEGQLENAKGRQIELLNDYRKSIISGFTDVEHALVAVTDTTETERLQREVVSASQRAYDLSVMQFQEGTIDLINLLQTQQTLFTAQDTLIQDRTARLNAVLSLYQALGGGWLPPPAPGVLATSR
jgi:NodT family efflux transporter outer membrane factor (OMF) lipoprotein